MSEEKKHRYDCPCITGMSDAICICLSDPQPSRAAGETPEQVARKLVSEIMRLAKKSS